MNWVLLLQTCLFLYLAWSVFVLGKNYLAARRSGFQVYICLANPSNPLWMVFGATIALLTHNLIPDVLWRRVKYAVYGWEFVEQERESQSSETAVMMVTPGSNELWIQDPEIGFPVLSRRKDFTQGEMAKLMIGIFGPNAITTDGHDWQRNRGFVAQSLNETISRPVWEESQNQAAQMVDSFLGKDHGRTSRSLIGLRKVAFNVLAFAGYGVANAWTDQPSSESKSHRLSYSEVLDTLTQGFIAIAVVPRNLLRLGWLPEAVRRVGFAAQEFPIYTKEMLEQERELSMASAEQRKNFMSSMVKLSDGEKDSTSANKGYLSEDEIQGNLFQFTVAGYDTTSNTLSYALSLLVVHEQWQDWIIEEIDSVLKSTDSLTYPSIFPKLTRCLAVMYETLRLFTPITSVGRSVDKLQTLDTPSGNFLIPKGTRVYVSLAKIHTDPQYWGDDALEFRPSRWITQNGPSIEKEVLNPHRDRFAPWSEGPRKCPGMKMAQVEFLSVMWTIFQTATVKPVVKPGETLEMAKNRILAVVRDSRPRLTLQMNNPEKIEIVWTKRPTLAQAG